jgi:hypothetical protein
MAPGDCTGMELGPGISASTLDGEGLSEARGEEVVAGEVDEDLVSVWERGMGVLGSDFMAATGALLILAFNTDFDFDFLPFLTRGGVGSVGGGVKERAVTSIKAASLCSLSPSLPSSWRVRARLRHSSGAAFMIKNANKIEIIWTLTETFSQERRKGRQDLVFERTSFSGKKCKFSGRLLDTRMKARVCVKRGANKRVTTH